MNNAWEAVRKFQKAFNQPAPDMPTILPGAASDTARIFAQVLEDTCVSMKKYTKENADERVIARGSWMLEELTEFLWADSLVDQADALIDLIYFAIGTFVEIGVMPENLFDIVNDANMDKLWHDGLPHFNDQGKIIKPDGWEAPEPKLADEIERQIAVGRKAYAAMRIAKMMAEEGVSPSEVANAYHREKAGRIDYASTVASVSQG